MSGYLAGFLVAVSAAALTAAALYFTPKAIEKWRNRKPKSEGWKEVAVQVAAESRQSRVLIAEGNQGIYEALRVNRETVELCFDRWREINSQTAGLVVEAIKQVCEEIRAAAPIGSEEKQQAEVLLSALAGIHQAVEGLGGLLSRHLEIQKRVSRTLEGKQDNENQEIMERALALIEEHPELRLEDAIARIRHIMPYSQKG